MTQRSINLVAAAILVIGGGVLAIWATRPRADDGAAVAPSTPAKSEPRRAHHVPFEVYARAAAGEWSAYRLDNGLPSGHVHTTVIRTITAEAPDHVTRTDRGLVDGEPTVHDEQPEDFPRAGLTLERLTGLDRAGWTISDLTVTVEPHPVGGRPFQATRISFASADPMFPRKRTHTDLWISTDVPAGSLVASREVQDQEGLHLVLTEELVGFGDAGGTRWGERPSGL
jgi:hypothetical protein